MILDFQNGDCYQDCSPRLLPTLAKIDKEKMTQELCKSICFNEKFNFAGVQNTHECWCGNDEPPFAKLRPLSECDMPCPGDTSEMCGGGCRMNIFEVSKRTSPGELNPDLGLTISMYKSNFSKSELIMLPLVIINRTCLHF